MFSKKYDTIFCYSGQSCWWPFWHLWSNPLLKVEGSSKICFNYLVQHNCVFCCSCYVTWNMYRELKFMHSTLCNRIDMQNTNSSSIYCQLMNNDTVGGLNKTCFWSTHCHYRELVWDQTFIGIWWVSQADVSASPIALKWAE